MMTFKQRLPYFLGGLTIGIIFVVFIFGKKDTTFDYGPNARLLKNIRTKDKIFSKEVFSKLSYYNLDTSAITKILTNGKGDMWNKQKIDDCTRYVISLENTSITVKNCDSIAYIENLTID